MELRVASSKAERAAHQQRDGGSIPTATLHFQTGQDAEAAALVMRYHYSKRVPNSIVFTGTFHEPGGLFGDCGEAVAACMLGIPPTRWSIPVIELQRLVRKDGIRVPLSRLVSLTCLYMRKKGVGDLLVSFADSTQGHHGGIYQACGWNYDGKRERRMDGMIFQGEFIGGRACNHKWGTQSPSKLAELGVVAEPHYDDGKHLYWKALTAKGEEQATTLGLKCEPYPKPKAN